MASFAGLSFAAMAVQVSLLDRIQIAAPCSADWEGMSGDERVRHCGECKLNVYNISEMRREEAERLITTTEGRLCVRLYRRRDGTVITNNCPVALRRIQKKLTRLVAGIAAAFGITLTSNPGCVKYYGMMKFDETDRTNEQVSSTSQPARGDYVPQMGARAYNRNTAVRPSDSSAQVVRPTPVDRK